MGKKLLFKVLGAAMAALIACPVVQANPLSPGGNVSPDSLSLSNYTQQGTTYTGTLTAGDYTATYTSAVYKDTTVGDSNFGELAFVYTVHNNSGSTGTIGSLALSQFNGYTTDVGDTGTGGVDPTNVSRSGGTGGTVTFDLNLTPGASTDQLVIETNAKTYSLNGQILSSNDDEATGPAFDPGPEPSSLILMAGSFLGIGGGAFWRRRKMRKVTA